MREKLKISRPAIRLANPNNESNRTTPQSSARPLDEPEKFHKENIFSDDNEDMDPLMPVDSKSIRNFLSNERAKVQLCFLKTKRPTTYANLFATLLAPTIAYISARFLQQQATPMIAKTTIMMQPTYHNAFNIALAFVTLFSFIGFDLLGRKWVFVISGLSIAIVVGTFIFWEPNSQILSISNFSSVCPWTVLSLSPLVIDYIKQESRGMGVSLTLLSIPLGEIATYGLIKAIGLNTNRWYQLMVPALTLLVLTVILFFLLREPQIKDPRSQRNRNTAPPPGIIHTCRYQIKTRPKFIYCFLALMDSFLIFTVCSNSLSDWINDMLEKEDPLGAITDEEGTQVYNQLMIGALIGFAVALPFIGLSIDKLDSKVTIPLSIITRGVCALGFMTISQVKGWYAHFLLNMLVLSSAALSISVLKMMLAGIKANIRGTMLGLACFFAQIGTTAFAPAAKSLIESHGAIAPFTLLSVVDCGMLLITAAAVMVCMNDFCF